MRAENRWFLLTLAGVAAFTVGARMRQWQYPPVWPGFLVGVGVVAFAVGLAGFFVSASRADADEIRDASRQRRAQSDRQLEGGD